MSVMCFGTLDDLVAAGLPKIGKTIWSSRGGKAYLYVALSSRWRAKIGAATNPAGRVYNVIQHWGDVQQIYVTQPRKDWRATELSLIEAMEGYQTLGWTCSESSREWFKLPKLVYAALRVCFLAGCTDNSIQELRKSINRPIRQHPMKTVIGKCSICGGRVTMPHVWMSVSPPEPTCDNCHAVAENAGPVIPMRPKDKPSTTAPAKPPQLPS